MPAVKGVTVYGPEELQRILSACSVVADPGERLRACGEALRQRLVADGYVSSRVFVEDQPLPGVIEVVEGRLVEVRVEGGPARIRRRVERMLTPLRGQVLNVGRVERDLQLLRRVQGVGEVRGRLARLGSDPSQATLTVTVPEGGPPWQGDVALRNDGNDGSGEYRGLLTFLKPSLLLPDDTLLLYGEVNQSDEGDYGTGIASISYTLPVADRLYLTGAFGYTRRNLVELPEPLDGLSTSQYQGLGQLEWVFRETLRDRWSVFAGYSASRSNTYLDNRTLPDLLPDTLRRPTSGYLRIGVNGRGIGDRVAWGGTAYLLQGVAAATPATQRRELAAAGIEPGQATALGGVLSASWGFAPSWQLNLRTAGQISFEPLTSPMQFILGSDVGLRGLPGQLISGDDGWLGTGEVVWTFWQQSRRRQALQLVPFIGVGWVRSEIADVRFEDTVGAGGILVRWLAGNWETELGWVEQFSEDDNLGVWQDWALGDGLYASLRYRF
jgi:hemolysin activation/secretion protein